MNKELTLIDRLTNLNLDNDNFSEIDFSNINWDDFLIYSLKSKTICIIFDSLESIRYLEIIPAKIYKLMSEIIIGNNEHNKVISFEKNKILTDLFNLKVNINEYKNLYTINTKLEELYMPNDIDLIALEKDKQVINNYFLKNGYRIKRINNELYVSNIQSDIKSILYEKNKTKKYSYPIKIDINYTFKSFINFECFMKDYYCSKNTIDQSCMLYIINIVDFFEHINCNITNITIDDFFKTKRLNIQYNSFTEKSKLRLKELIIKYGLTDIFKTVENIILNYTSFF